MDKDRIKGSAQQAKGTVKEVAGKVTGDAKLESEGKADKAAGKIRNAVGGLKDTLRGKYRSATRWARVANLSQLLGLKPCQRSTKFLMRSGTNFSPTALFEPWIQAEREQDWPKRSLRLHLMAGPKFRSSSFF